MQIKYDIIKYGKSAGQPAIFLIIDNEIDIKKIDEFLEQYPCGHILITGDIEPLERWRELASILSNKKLEGWIIDMETYGSTMPDYTIRKYITNWIIKPGLKEEFFTDAISFFAQASNAYFIFKAKTVEDFTAIKEFIKWNRIEPRRSIVQPDAKSISEYIQMYKGLKTMCMEMNMQIGIDLELIENGRFADREKVAEEKGS